MNIRSLFSGFRGSWALCATALLFQAVAIPNAIAAAPKILVIGDTAPGPAGRESSTYSLAAKAEMEAISTDVTYKTYTNPGAALTDADFVPAGGGKYDFVVLTAVWGGLTTQSVQALSTAIQTRAATAFFLFPDQCSSCASNVDQITVPVLNAATNWNVQTGSLYDDSNVHSAGTVALNTLSKYAASFSALSPMAVYDYRALNNVPAQNALYFPRSPEQVPLPTQNQMDTNARVSGVAALIVPAAQSYNGTGACIFTISDVNVLSGPGNPPVGKLAGLLRDATDGSCSVDSGKITVTKTLVQPPAGANASANWPMKFQFSANCDKPAANTVYTSNQISFTAAGQQTVDIANIPDGANCTVTETPLTAAPANYNWVVSPSQATAAIVKNTATPVSFQNTLLGSPASIGITKQMTLPSGMTDSFAFTFTANCTVNGSSVPPQTSAPLLFPASNTTSIPNVPADAQCAVTESLPPPPTGYLWDTPQFDASSISTMAGATTPLVVTNKLIRQFAALNLTTTVSGGPASGLTGAFQYAVNCGIDGSFSSTVNLSSSSSGTNSIANVPVGASCEVTQDTQVPSAPDGYQWGSAPSKVTIVIPATGGSASFLNTLSAKATSLATPVPSLGQWALMLLSLVMAGFAVVGLRRSTNVG